MDVYDVFEAIEEGRWTVSDFREWLESPASKPQPLDTVRSSGDESVRAARAELAGVEKITFEEARRLGGPRNPKVADLIRRGLVEDVAVPFGLDDALLNHKDPAVREQAQQIAQDLAQKTGAERERAAQQAAQQAAERARTKMTIEEASKLPWDVRRRAIAEGRVEGVQL